MGPRKPVGKKGASGKAPKKGKATAPDQSAVVKTLGIPLGKAAKPAKEAKEAKERKKRKLDKEVTPAAEPVLFGVQTAPPPPPPAPAATPAEAQAQKVGST